MRRLNYPDNWSTQQRDDLDNMFVIARAKELWFYANYQGLWFSPDELEKEQKQGKFLWTAENWQLRKRRDFFQEAREKFHRAKQEYEYALKRYMGDAEESNAEIGRMLGI